MPIYDEDGQITLFVQDGSAGKMSQEPSARARRNTRTSALSWKKLLELKAVPFMSLDLTPGHGNLLGESYWEIISPWLGGSSMLNTGPAPLNGEGGSSLSQILQDSPPRKYYLSRTACLGILRRARERGKELPEQLKTALMAQAGLTPWDSPVMTQSSDAEPVGFDGYNGDLTDEVSATLGTNCGMSTGRNGVITPIAFAANERDEVRDLHDVAGALGSQPGMKQQTFIAEGCLNPWDTQQARVFIPEGKAPTLAGADGGGGRNPAGLLFAAGVVTKGNGDCFLTPERHTSLTSGGGQAGQGYPCVLTAGFCAGAAPTAGGIGYQEEISPTLKAAESGTNMVPSILCLNDQGGSVMEFTENISGTLRAQEHGHQPLVLATQQGGAEIGVGVCPTITAAAGMSGNNQPVLFENHGIDSRYTGPHPVSPTLSARAGTGGNNLPIVAESPCYCITGNAIDRQPQNGGNGIGYQEDIAYTLTATDHHAVYEPYQKVVGALCRGDEKGAGSQYVSQDKCIVEAPHLIRRLTPLECERLQGFPDGWTDLPDASDSARYKALGNSVAIPCVEYIMRGITMAV